MAAFPGLRSAHPGGETGGQPIMAAVPQADDSDSAPRGR
jgi:hypothetical protein